MPPGNWVKPGWWLQMGKRRFTSICGGESESEWFHVEVVKCRTEAAGNFRGYYFQFGCSAENMQGSGGGSKEDKELGGCAGRDERPDASPSSPCGCAGRQRKALSQESKCHTVAVSASGRKWIHVICPLPEGTELLTAGFSILVEPLHPITTLSQPIQLLVLIAFFHPPPSLSCIPASACCGEAISFRQCLSEVPPVLDPRLLLPVCVCVCVCLSLCVCVWISNGGWLCVCVPGKKGRVFSLTFAEQSASTRRSSWILVGFGAGIENGGAEHHCIYTNNHSRLLGAEDNYTDSTHACTSRRSAWCALSGRSKWCDPDEVIVSGKNPRTVSCEILWLFFFFWKHAGLTS